MDTNYDIMMDFITKRADRLEALERMEPPRDEATVLARWAARERTLRDMVALSDLLYEATHKQWEDVFTTKPPIGLDAS